jgi:hypothetical protein
MSILAHFARIPGSDEKFHIHISLRQYLNTTWLSWQLLASAPILIEMGRFQIYINIRILTRGGECVIMHSVIVESLARLGTQAGN